MIIITMKGTFNFLKVISDSGLGSFHSYSGSSIFRCVCPGATSVELLSEYFRLGLLQEAQSYPYTPEPEVVGTGNQGVLTLNVNT